MVNSNDATALTQALNELTKGGLESVVHTDVQDAPPQENPLVKLSLLGQDRTGIIREISHVLASHGVNVEELNTERKRAPNSGQKLFQAEAQLRLPQGFSIDSLHAALEQVAADMMVDISLE